MAQHSILYLRELFKLTNTIRILLVEDERSAIETYQDAANDVPSRHDGLKIDLVHISSAEGALEQLQNGSFDGAIVDLNLNSDNPQEAAGNEVIRAIYKKNRFPVKVITGNLANLDQDLVAEGNPFLTFSDRDGIENDVVFDQFITLYKTGITKILGRKGELETLLGEVFWEHFVKDIDDWGEGSEKVLLRHTLNHLNEYIDRTLTKYDEREFYIKPPIKKHIATGDVVSKGEEKYLVVSPACDVTPRNGDGGAIYINADRIILCPLLDISREVWIAKKLIEGDYNTEKRKAAITKIVQSQDPKFHFLPKHGDLHASISDFQNIITCTLEDFMNDYVRIATVSGDFMRDIQSRFTAYIGRQGQPDLDKKELIRSIAPRLTPVAN